MAFKALLIPPPKQSPRPVVPMNAPTHAPPTHAPPTHAPPTHARPAAQPVTAEPKTKATKTEAAPDLLDPTTRLAAQLAPPLASTSAPATEHVASRARVSLEELVPQVLRRIAWGGDRTKGSVHLELTSGDRVTVHAEGRRVRIEVSNNSDLERRIGSRLRAAGIEVEGVG